MLERLLFFSSNTWFFGRSSGGLGHHAGAASDSTPGGADVAEGAGNVLGGREEFGWFWELDSELDISDIISECI